MAYTIDNLLLDFMKSYYRDNPYASEDKMIEEVHYFLNKNKIDDSFIDLFGNKIHKEKPVSINRAWAMPSKHTFKIKPISELIKRYIGDGIGWIDPFAGENSPAEITNDLNPEKPTLYHNHAKEFASLIQGEYDGCLFDPPYSLRQVKECYDSIGIKLFQEDTQRFPQNVKEIIAKKIKTNGVVITFGWNSQGFGKNLGFKIKEILIVAHGRGHNDTIVTVETKIK